MTNAQKVAAWRRRLKRRLIEAAGGKCVKCGYDRCAAALQFHHRDPSKKEFSISRSGNTRSIARALEEIKKCDLFCANCHAEVHAEIDSGITQR